MCVDSQIIAAAQNECGDESLTMHSKIPVCRNSKNSGNVAHNLYIKFMITVRNKRGM